MSLSGAQHGRMAREWKLACEVQGWTKEQAEPELRKFFALHKLPASRRDWHAKKDFDVFLAEVKPLQNRVDIRDREREGVEIGIERLDAAICAIDGRAAGTYTRGIVRDMHDRESHDALPAAELENLRDTLKNRLSKLLATLRGTARAPRRKSNPLTCPASLEWALDVATNPAIEGIIAGKVVIAIRPVPSRVFYRQLTREEYVMHLARKVVSEPVPVAAEPVVKRPALRPLYAGIPDEGEETEMPF